MALTKTAPQASFAFYQNLPPFSREVFDVLVSMKFGGPEERLTLLRRLAEKTGNKVTSVSVAAKILIQHGFMRERLDCDANRVLEFSPEGWSR